MVEIYLGLGSNLGNRIANLNRCLRILKKSGLEITKVSSVYETEPVGNLSQNDFLNAVIKAKTSLPPSELLVLCKQTELKLKRKKTRSWGPRIIDLDILLYGNKVIRSSLLTVPHKEMLKRRFVLQPLAEIAPNKRHPVEKKTFKKLLLSLRSRKKAVKTGKLKWI